MYTEKLKESMGGIVGSFVLKDGDIAEADLNCDFGFVVQSLLYLREAVTERKSLTRFTVFGENHNFSVYFYPGHMVGVLLTGTANIQLLNLMVRRILEPVPEELAEPPPPSFENLVPFFDRPREEVLPNVPVYARQVLEFVDGTRTIKDIIEQSMLPPEVVLDVILSFRRSSVLHYKS